jgi:hypothetical protein
MAAIITASDLAIDYGAINEANLDQLRKLNLSIFPVRYNDKFYQNVILTPPEITQVWNTYTAYLSLITRL